MPFIKRHVTRRLKAAKLECDKDLQRVTNAITVFFEEKLREGDLDHDRMLCRVPIFIVWSDLFLQSRTPILVARRSRTLYQVTLGLLFRQMKPAPTAVTTLKSKALAIVVNVRRQSTIIQVV